MVASQGQFKLISWEKPDLSQHPAQSAKKFQVGSALSFWACMFQYVWINYGWKDLKSSDLISELGDLGLGLKAWPRSHPIRTNSSGLLPERFLLKMEGYKKPSQACAPLSCGDGVWSSCYAASLEKGPFSFDTGPQNIKSVWTANARQEVPKWGCHWVTLDKVLIARHLDFSAIKGWGFANCTLCFCKKTQSLHTSLVFDWMVLEMFKSKTYLQPHDLFSWIW